MGRPSSSRNLTIWANGVRVGVWTLRPNQAMLQYDPAWLDSSLGRPLSLSLPFDLDNAPITGPAVSAYFENLLPDSDTIRRRIAEKFGTPSTDAFDLLKAIGRDCVGAIQIMGEDEEPQGFDRIEGIPCSEADLDRYLTQTTAPASLRAARDEDDDFRISLAGAQEKTAFLWHNGQWLKPTGSTPTTHIFKLPLGLMGGKQADFSTSVDNEWLCLKLLQAYGLPVNEADIATFGRHRVLVVKRFDRKIADHGQWILRLPQEDFCQATGTAPTRKYQADGGPGLEQLSMILQTSLRREQDLRTLMASQILFWLLRAPDGHAKNFSIHLSAKGRISMTPLYDVMSAYPVLGNGANQWAPQRLRLAMAMLGKSRHDEASRIQRRHFNSTAARIGYGPDAEDLIEEIIARTPAVIAQTQASLPGDFSARVAETLLGGLEQAVAALRSMPPT
ncbi:serine/threonine-protein kinase HipA [Comamonas sp. BIGb0124]|uniref:type II toxin-antitoxin system HipA family toxin n=1 Tax=Comamonas sp. BIGb0124 TaxID=2485130 RepID=UPI000F46032A|nr:type II toxin-antitoxin system HipA family toxin [Comamonas sp. BIGb0124]ROR18564.1 serine/threonine-protein kinase HipA [Comamonas sp. BIGb0124]